MFAAYIGFTLLTAGANIFSAMCDFVRYKQVSIAMARAGVPNSWMTTLGVLKAAGALGLLVGIGVPFIGTAAATGLVLFFVVAIIIHRRAHDYTFGPGCGLSSARCGLAGARATRERADVFGAPHELRSAWSSRLIRNEV